MQNDLTLAETGEQDPNKNHPATEASTPRFKRIKDTAVGYENGGAFEASHFAKGDGWRTELEGDTLDDKGV